MSKKEHLYIDQATDYEKVITVANTNLTNCTSFAHIKKFYTSNTYVSMTTSLDVANSTITLSLDANTSLNMDYGRYVYDVELIDEDNKRTRIQEGILTINPNVTDSRELT